MIKIINCKCGAETWFEDNYNTAMIDAYRMLKLKCGCEKDEV
jgi:hypothetical protein